jgi:D-glycero-alpha-D-manno-heptose-7-phosphate kinase
MIITRSPLRISIGGGGTDLPFYYEKEGGSLITAAIDKYVYCTIKDRFEDKVRLSYSENEDVRDIRNLKNDRARKILELEDLRKNIEVSTLADVPSGSGMGSSGAFAVGMIRAAKEYKGESLDDKEAAERAFDIEHNKLEYPCGKQDQYASSYGGLFQLEIDKDGKTEVNRLDISESSVEELEKNLMLFYTGKLRHSEDILQEQKEEVLTNEEKMNKMRQIKEIGEKIRYNLAEGNIDKFGELLHEHWETKKKFTDNMSSSSLDKTYTEAIENEALGGKIMGAGGGGFFVFYVKKNKDRFIDRMEGLGLKKLDFSFDNEGSKVIYRE